MKRILDYLEKTIVTVCAALFIGITLLIAAQVFTRYVLNNALSWSEQAARMLFIWMTLLYAGILVRRMANLGFDIVTGKLPKRVREGLQVFSSTVILVFSLYWAWNAVVLCQSFVGLRFSGIKIPYNAVYSAEIAGALLIAVFSLELIVGQVSAMLAERRSGT